MELKEGTKAVHKLTGHEMLILEVGPKTKKVLVPARGWVEEEYLSKGIVRVRLTDMKVIDVYDYEIMGVDADDTGRIRGPGLLMEN